MQFLERGYSEKPEIEWAPLLLSMVSCRAADELRYEMRRVEVAAANDDGDHDEGMFFDALLSEAVASGRLHAQQHDPFDLAHLHRLADAIRKALDTLTDRQRSVFIERYLGGSSREEIASRLGIGIESVKAHLNAALRKLRSHPSLQALASQ
jgi:RNA polymerase sigma factor (sigma-70 family)